jgi:hypothetical protein
MAGLEELVDQADQVDQVGVQELAEQVARVLQAELELPLKQNLTLDPTSRNCHSLFPMIQVQIS